MKTSSSSNRGGRKKIPYLTLPKLNNNENQLQGQTSSFLRSILGMNKRSLGLHLNELKILLGSFANIPDIIAITESWLTENDDPENYNLEGYQPIESFPRKDAKHRSGGGSVIC